MSNNWNRKFYLLAFGLFLALAVVQAQPKFNSPYSRIGLGDLWNTNFAGANGMADLSAAYYDPYHTNINNPASLGYLRSTAFEIGIRSKYGNLESPSGDATVWSGNLAYLSLAFPMKNPISRVLDRDESKFNWGMSITLLPYTTVGYLIETEETDVTRPDIESIRYNFEGSGGTYKLVWGNGFKYDQLSFGVSLGYLFGKIEQDQEVSFDSLFASYSNLLLKDISHSGVVWNIGAQYDFVFEEGNNRKALTVGAYVSPATNFNTRSTIFNSRFNLDYNSIDTVFFDDSFEGSGKLPTEFSIGFMYQSKNKIRLGFNFSQANWSNYQNDVKDEGGLSDTRRYEVGLEYIPDITSYNSYSKKIRYRFGAFYGTDPRSDGFNEQLTNYGITIGLGLPVILPRQQQSFMNVALELGQFGSEQFLRETYAQLTLGFTLNDNSWFFKRKFN